MTMHDLSPRLAAPCPELPSTTSGLDAVLFYGSVVRGATLKVEVEFGSVEEVCSPPNANSNTSLHAVLIPTTNLWLH